MLKKILITLISTSLILVSPGFCKNLKHKSRAPASVDIKNVDSNLAEWASLISQMGWSFLKIGDKKISIHEFMKSIDSRVEGRAVNHHLGLGIKLVKLIRSKRHNRLLVAVYRSSNGVSDDMFTFSNRIAYKRFDLNLDKIKKNSIKERALFDNRMTSLSSQIEMMVGDMKTSLLDLFVSSAFAGNKGLCSTKVVKIVVALIFCGILIFNVAKFFRGININGYVKVVAFGLITPFVLGILKFAYQSRSSVVDQRCLIK